MPFKDYYLILGVPRGESQAGIHARYRDLAKSLHPDVAGEDSTTAFQDVTEAYGVLSDPAHRREHNRDLRAHEGPGSRPRVSTEAPTRVRGPQPVSLSGFQTVRPSFEALFEQILRNFTGAHVPKSEHLEPLEFEVVLTPEEARDGGSVPIGIPLFRVCRMCSGTGRDWMLPCSRCGGLGMVAEERAVEVPIPPISHAPVILEVPLDGLGIHNLYLRLHIYVSSSG